jgi:hypothetical protein
MDSNFVIWVLAILASSLLFISFILLFALLKSNSRIIEINKHLMILIAGKEKTPDTMRALVAADRQPKTNLPGISNKKDEKKKETSANKDYVMSIGGGQ